MLDYNAFELVDHAVSLEYRVLALTLHGCIYYPEELRKYAQSKGILLIPGIELYLDRREVLLLGNCFHDVASLRTLHDLRALKKLHGEDLLVIAPHPFYGLPQCLGKQLEKYADVFDAVEFCHFYTSWWNPNRRAEEVAHRINKPMIACSDTHQLKWMGHHYHLVDAKQTKEDVFTAIRAGRIRNVSRPLSNKEFAKKTFWHIAIADPRKLACKWGWIQRMPSKRCRKGKGGINKTVPSAMLH